MKHIFTVVFDRYAHYDTLYTYLCRYIWHIYAYIYVIYTHMFVPAYSCEHKHLLQPKLIFKTSLLSTHCFVDIEIYVCVQNKCLFCASLFWREAAFLHSVLSVPSSQVGYAAPDFVCVPVISEDAMTELQSQLFVV